MNKNYYATDLAHQYYNSFTLTEVVPELIIRDAVLYYFWNDIRIKLYNSNKENHNG